MSLRRLFLGTLAFVLTGIFFIFDIVHPRGVAGGVPYVIVLMVAFMLRSEKLILGFAALGTLLTIAGFFLSAPSSIPLYVELLNRFVAVFAIGIIAAICYQYLKTQAKFELQLQALAETDPLTQIYNRRSLFREIQRSVREAERYSHPFALLLLDIDRFKRVNDIHGHLAGDAVLKAVADAILDCLRGVDVLGRYGGEEFLVLLPNTDVVGAKHIGERIRTAVESLTVAYENERLSVTVSVGIAGFSDKITSMEALIRATDDALYRAKQQGRNRVVIY